jgi:hypothetical protein
MKLTMIALKKEGGPCKMHRTYSKDSSERLHRRRLERKIKDVLGEDQFGFRRGKELGMQC